MAKRKISVSLDDELIELIDKEIKKYKFANRSHALEYCISRVLKEGKNEKK